MFDHVLQVCFSVSLGHFFSELPAAIITGCGVGIAFIILTVLAILDGDGEPIFWIWVACGVVLLLASAVLIWINYSLTVFAIAVLSGCLVSSVIILIFIDNLGYYDEEGVWASGLFIFFSIVIIIDL